jgi:hypothetical protein
MLDHALLALAWLTGTVAGWATLAVVFLAGCAVGHRRERRAVGECVMLAREDEALAVWERDRAKLDAMIAREAHARTVAQLEALKSATRRFYAGQQERPVPLSVEVDR